MRSNSGLYGREETADPALDGYIDGDNIWLLWGRSYDLHGESSKNKRLSSLC